MKIFYCPCSGFSLFYETKYGLRIHLCHQHNRRARSQFWGRSAQNLHPPIPTTLTGPGKQLRVDRVTQSVFGDVNAQNVNMPEIETKAFQTKMLPMSAKSQIIEDAYANLCKLMIDLTTRTSVIFCNEVLQILGKNTKVPQFFLS